MAAYSLFNFRIALAHYTFLKGVFKKHRQYLPCDRFKQNLSASLNKRRVSVPQSSKIVIVNLLYVRLRSRKGILNEWQILPQKLYHNALSRNFPSLFTIHNNYFIGRIPIAFGRRAIKAR